MIFWFTITYLLLLALFSFLIYEIIRLRKTIQAQTQNAKELDEKLYTELRMVQYNALDITKMANKFTKEKNSLLGNLIVPILIAILPFKKLKSLLYLHKLSKKVI